MQVECPQCGTRVEKPASGSPVCHNCGYGSAAGAAGPSGGQPQAGRYSQPQPGGGYGQPPQGGAPYGGQPQGGPPQGQEQGLAIASLILGIAGCLFAPVLASIAAIVLAVMAKNKIKENPQRYGGEGMATAGLWLGIISLVLGVIFFIIWIAFVGFALTAFDAYCDENPDDPDCQDEGLVVGGDAPPVPHGDGMAAMAAPWIVPPFAAVHRRAPSAV